MSRREHGRVAGRTQLQRAVDAHKDRLRENLTLPVLPDRADRLLGVLQAMGVWVCEFDVDARLRYSSPECEAILGFTAEQCLSSDCIEFHPDDVERVGAASRRVRETGEVVRNQVRMRHRRGHWVHIEASISGWYPSDGGGFHTLVFVRDMSELKTAQAQRRESDARYQVVAHMSSDLIFEFDSEGRTTYVSPGAQAIVGYSAEELLEIDLLERVHPDDTERVRRYFARELNRTGSDPQPHHSSLRPRRMLELRVEHRDGHWVWLETHGLDYLGADGKRRYLAVARDVSQRKSEERARHDLLERVQSAQKLESLGVLAGGIAHDFNNLLTPILGAAGLGLEELPADSPVESHLLKIQKAARRAASLTDQMLAYAGQKPLGVDPVGISELVGEMRSLLASSISGKATLDLDLAPDLPHVEAEAAQLSQVVMNLIMNAAESLQDGAGRIEIRTGMLEIDSAPPGALFADTMTPGRHVWFEVADSGCGMDPDTCSRIFDPFFTTKFTGRGLGLAAVAGIVRGHRGAIEVSSIPGEGTRFRVLLPASAGGAEVGAPRAEPTRSSTRRLGTVLVIDDDEGVREIAEAVLHRSGLSVLTASDGHEGVKLFGLHADEIDVILLDRTMPSLSGAETFDAIRAVRGDARIVLVSGYTQERATAELAGRGLFGFLRKPFAPEELLERVQQALDD